MKQTELTELATELANRVLFTTKEVLTSDETAKYMGVSKSYLYKLTMNKIIPHYKPTGKVVYFNRLEVEQWLQSNRVSSANELKERVNVYCAKGGVV
ncbi:MAG: helix-turn-helix domain-containing protein [Bacteroidales bacterium]|nr:helix-turn-helix domain-containing protein [Bacteroidales bacterium]